MKSRLAAGIAGGLAMLGLVGCAPTAPPASPTPTPPFTSAAAAYRAAETTYRAYVDAGNHVDLADPKTFQPVYAWLLGDALRTDEEELTAMAAKGWSISGAYQVTLLEPTRTDDNTARWGDISLTSCLDVSRVQLTDSDGRSVVSPSRKDLRPLRVSFSRDAATPTGMKIIKIEDRVGGPVCHS